MPADVTPVDAERAPHFGADVLPVRVSVVVPCRNEERSIGPCLDSILATAAYPRAALEVLVVDDRSMDATREVA